MAGLNIEEYKKMPKEFQKPKLEKWFQSNINKKTIGIWQFAAYGKEPQRSPSLEWWEKLLPEIILQWIGRTRSSGLKGVGYLSFLLRTKPNLKLVKPDAFFVTAYDEQMKQRECLGNVKTWNKTLEKEIIQKVINNARTTSRLNGGIGLHIPVKYYSITYL